MLGGRFLEERLLPIVQREIRDFGDKDRALGGKSISPLTLHFPRLRGCSRSVSGHLLPLESFFVKKI